MSMSATVIGGRDNSFPAPSHTTVRMPWGTTHAQPPHTGANTDRELVESEDNLHETFVSYIQALTGSSRRRIPLVWMEHSYARSATARAVENAGGSAPKLLLVRHAPQCPDCHSEGEDDDNVDIESVDPEPAPPLALDELPQCEKAFEETETLVEEDDKPDWEDRLNSLPWNPSQLFLLSGAMEAILSSRAALLTAGKNGAKRAAARGGGARAFRELLAAPPIRWQSRFVQWLHNALMEHLPTPLLSCYQEIILTLKGKVPSLVEKMTVGHPITGRVRGFENGSSGPLIASASGVPPDPAAPIILLLPSGRDKRDARWAERLRSVGQVHQVHSHQSSWLPNLPVSACLFQLVTLSKTRVASLKSENPHRPIVLVGQGPGAAIAIQVAVNVSGIAGVVCLGLPLLTAEGARGDPEDSLLCLPCPILFVIGQNASQSSQQDVESLRLKLRIRSHLVVAGSADDLLRLPRVKRQLEGVTQRMLECAIADEVGNFLTCLSQWDESLDGSMPPGSPSESCDNESIDADIPVKPANISLTVAVSQSQSVMYGGSATVQTGNIVSPKNFLPSPSAVTSPPATLTPASLNMSSHAVKRKGGKNITMPKAKKPRTVRAVKWTSPLKGRGMALYHVNNPPPEGTSISLGVLLNTSNVNEDSTELEEKTSPSAVPPILKSETASYLQISNNKLTKSYPLSGNGSFKDSKSSSSGIKVLENIPIKVSQVMTPKVLSTVSGLGNTPLILPIKSSHRNLQVKNNQVTSITPTNIMDIPIIFADDEKVGTPKLSTPLSGHVTTSAGIKSIIFNKQPLITNSSSKLVQLKVPPSNPPPGITTITTTPTICYKQNLASNPNVKFTKLIVKKRTPEKTQALNIISAPDPNNDVTRKYVGKPIIVKSKAGPVTAFKVLPASILQKSSQPRQLIIKKTSTVSTIMTSPLQSNKIGTNLDSTSDKAIEAAVASITKEQEIHLDNL